MPYSPIITEIEKEIINHTQVGVMLVDIADFTLINVALGFEIGDKVIDLVHSKLKSFLTSQINILKYHSDKFIVILPGVVSQQKLEPYARLIVNYFVKHNLVINSLEIPIDVKVAYGSTEMNFATGKHLLSSLEMSLRELKSDNSDISRTTSIRKSGNEHQFRQIARYGVIREAIEKNQFINNYQPIINLKSGRLVGCECLVRWYNPDIGATLPPSSFLPHLTRHSHLVQLTLTVVRNLVRDFKDIHRDLPEDFYMAINVPPVVLMDPAALSRVFKVLDKAEFPYRRIAFEMTEQDFTGSFEGIVTVCNNLNNKGIKLLIDDFGTGYSSIERIADLPIYGIKVDKQFMLRRSVKVINATVIKFAKDIAEKKNAVVICEGIEDEDILLHAQELDVQFGQGFHFSKPVPLPEFKALLNSQTFAVAVVHCPTSMD